MKGFEVVPSSTRWPPQDYVSVAMISIGAEMLSKVLGVPLVHGVESGLGPWEAVGLRLSSGTLVELVRYELKPEPKGFELRVGSGATLFATLNQVIALLGVSTTSLLWVSPLAHA